MPALSSVDRFTQLKARRDILSNQLATLNGRLSSSRDRYNDIMRELAAYGIGSVDELRKESLSLSTRLDQHLDAAEAQIAKMEQDLKQLDAQQ